MRILHMQDVLWIAQLNSTNVHVFKHVAQVYVFS